MGLTNQVRWYVVAGYAIAMAWVEAAVVYYLRTMVDRIEPHQANPLPLMGGFGMAEFIREAATLVMLLAVGALAGRCWRTRLGYTAIAFGIWDIFYYVFLKVLCDWPHSIFDWDILFLVPLPWWGPVLAPVMISVLMILWGTLVANQQHTEHSRPAELIAWGLNLCGVALALLVFMADTLPAASHGIEAVRNVVPQKFGWAWFNFALLLLSAPPLLAAYRLVLRNKPNCELLNQRTTRSAANAIVASRVSEAEL